MSKEQYHNWNLMKKTVVKNEPITFWQALFKRSAVWLQMDLGHGHR